MTGTYAAAYDAWNRLVFVWVDANADGDHDAGETVIARYEYDGLSRRTKKHLNADTDDDYDAYRHFFYNAGLGLRSLGGAGWQILETRRSDSENDPPESESPEVQYVWSRRYIDSPVLRDRDADSDSETGDLGKSGSGLDERLYYTTDANMNVTALVETDGDVVERYVYDPYGSVTIYDADWSDDVTWANSKKNNIRYCGYYLDDETGLYCVRYRFYDPPLGRWLQRDPARPRAEPPNLYLYVDSSPHSSVDPLGLWKIERKNQGTALATAEPPDDTVESLASIIGLDSGEWKKWLQPATPGSPNSYGIISLRSGAHRACGAFKIPNTILAVWAGWEGLGEGFGKFWVMWGKDVADLKGKGFSVVEKRNEKKSAILGEISNLTGNRTLHGFLFWGHGSDSGLRTKENAAGNRAYSLSYHDVRKARAYKLAFAMVYACHGDAALDPKRGGITSPNATGWGGKGTIAPLPFHLTGPTVCELLPDGKQGTNP